MEQSVLIVTGGLITSQETSLWNLTRRLFIQGAHAKNAWLELKVKCLMAEPLLGLAAEKLKLSLWRKMNGKEAGAGPDPRKNSEIPSLTEVVLATLLER